MQLVGDLLVAGGGGEAAAVAQRAAQRDQHPLLGLGQARQRRSLAGDHGRVGRGRLTEVVGEHRAPDADQVPVLQALAPEHPLAVEEGAVGRQPVVDDRPFAAEALELGVQPRHLSVPGDRDARLGAPADRAVALLAPELEQHQPAVPAPQGQERLAALRRAASRSFSSLGASECGARGSLPADVEPRPRGRQG